MKSLWQISSLEAPVASRASTCNSRSEHGGGEPSARVYGSEGDLIGVEGGQSDYLR
jgi:hypothetical protein